MKSFLRFACAALALALTSGWVQALDFKSVGAAPAILYDAPSAKGRKVFIAPPGMPVEVVLTYGEWTKVRDASGDLSWVASGALAPQRTVVVSASQATIRSAPQAAAAPVFTAAQHVLLELAEPAAAGWLQVRHRDGDSGYVNASEVWGE